MNTDSSFLGKGFLTSWNNSPNQTALSVGNRSQTYAELGKRALSVRQTLNSDVSPSANRIGLLVGDSIDAYSSILGILFSGRAYVPMNPEHPAKRNRQIIEDAELQVIIVDESGVEKLPAILENINQPSTVLYAQNVEKTECPELGSQIDTEEIHNIHNGSTDVNQLSPDDIQDITSTDTAYILFTSGSTGRPKGVPITHRNVRSYIEFIREKYEFDSSDRFSQFFDLTFDLSVHDMFVCWGVGGSLYIVSKEDQMAPGRFISDNEITVWFTVPSTAMFMSQFGQMQPDTYPNLRYSFFCGEALSGRLASKWQKAAPNTIVENLYGPTEATIATSRYRWVADESLEHCENGIVPIGRVFPHQQRKILDENGDVVVQGQEGELCVAGPQVFNGYLNRPQANNESFVEADGTKWYRTGDLVREDNSGCLHFISRIDNQIQIRGHRVELLEIEATIRDIVDTEMVATVGWPIEEGIAQSIQTFIVSESNINSDNIISECEGLLPDYMVPKEIHLIEEMPLNVNGKIDRKQLENRLEETNV